MLPQNNIEGCYQDNTKKDTSILQKIKFKSLCVSKLLKSQLRCCDEQLIKTATAAPPKQSKHMNYEVHRALLNLHHVPSYRVNWHQTGNLAPFTLTHLGTLSSSTFYTRVYGKAIAGFICCHHSHKLMGIDKLTLRATPFLQLYCLH